MHCLFSTGESGGRIASLAPATARAGSSTLMTFSPSPKITIPFGAGFLSQNTGTSTACYRHRDRRCRTTLHCRLRNHSSLANLVSDRVSVTGLDGRWGSSHSSVTALSIMCRSTLLHFSQVNIRRSWPNPPGSIAINVIGESQSMHCGLWFCVSSMSCSPGGP
jgi:hypothetical protein